MSSQACVNIVIICSRCIIGGSPGINYTSTVNGVYKHWYGPSLHCNVGGMHLLPVVTGFGNPKPSTVGIPQREYSHDVGTPIGNRVSNLSRLIVVTVIGDVGSIELWSGG